MHASKTALTQSAGASHPAASRVAPLPATIAQRLGNGRMESLLRSRLQQSNLTMQAKLEVGRADDPLEREADRVAEYVQGGPMVQRKCSHCEEERMQRSAGPDESAPTVDAALESSIVSSLGGGSSLSRPLRDAMEQSFAKLGVSDVDFSGVRVHTGPQANRATREVAARAFTVGRDVFFRDGEYQPGTSAGVGLLAHELTHVVQQGRASSPTVQRKPVASELLAKDLAFPFKDDALNEAHQAGVKISVQSDIDRRVQQIWFHPDSGSVARGRQEYKTNPAAAMSSLYSTHFRTGDERLSYALGVFREKLGLAPGSDELFSVFRDYAIKVETQASDLIVHDPPTAAEQGRLESVLETREDELYALYLAEVEHEKQTALLVNGTGVYSGVHDVDGFQQFIGGPIEELEEGMKAQAPAVVSMLLDFVPIVGQLKAVVEGIVGEDLITGEELADWQRGLGILLAVIPEVKGVFSAGKAGVRLFAKAVAKTGQAASKVWRVARVASKLSVGEVRFAMRAADAGAARRMAKVLTEMDGGASAALRPLEPLAAGARSVTAALPTLPVTLGGQTHKILFGRIGARVGAILCSECGLLIERAATLARELDKGHPLRRELEKLIEAANKADRWVNKAIRVGGHRAADAERELAKLRDVLTDVERRYPGELLRDAAAGEGHTSVDALPFGGSPEARGGSPIRSSETTPHIGETEIPEKSPARNPRPKAEPSIAVDPSVPHAKFASEDEALLHDVVGEARKKTAEVIDEVGSRGGVPRGQEHLSPECMAGSCGFSRRAVARELTKAGVADGKIFMNQVADIAGTGAHTFTVLETAPRRFILIDTTFAQFTGALDGAPRLGEIILGKSGKLGALIRKELLERGYLVLTDEIADVYVKVVSESARGGYRVRDLTRAQASLARNLHLLQGL